MNRFFTLALCGAASIVMATTADAQIVRWGPGGGVRVRAPFVAVDVLPYGGGTSVRAPFAAVDSRYYSYRPGVAIGPVPPLPIYPLPAYPRVYRRAVYPRVIYPGAVFPGVVYPGAVYPGVYPPVVAPGVVYPESRAQVDLSARSEVYRPEVYQSGRPEIPVAVPDRLRASAEALAKTLTVRQDGDVWLNYLEPQRIIETIDLRRSPATLKDLVANYDGVVGNSSLGMIREARGFRETHELLHAFLQTPETPRSETQPAETGSADPARPAESLPLPPPAESPTAKPSDSPAEPAAVPTPPAPEPPTPRPPQTAKPTSL